MATRLTKQQLLERIAALESELGLANQTVAQLQAEVNAEMVRARPSRTYSRTHDFAPTVPVTAEAKAVPFRERCARARELAMRTGRCVQVMH